LFLITHIVQEKTTMHALYTRSYRVSASHVCFNFIHNRCRLIKPYELLRNRTK